MNELFSKLSAEVNAYLPEALARLHAPAALAEAMQYSVSAPGKRLRPILLMLSAMAAGGNSATALPAAAAAEFVHTYSLIHDDLPAMDDDDIRRGRPTCHKKFGEALAILAGDALLTGAFQLLTESYPPAIAAQCVRELAAGAGAAGMVGGQVEDLAWERDPSGSSADLERVHRLKTGALFQACLRIGGWIGLGERRGEAGEQVLECLDAFGRSFGLAFQITDDLLDVEGDAALVGKTVHKDAGRGKLTYPGLLGIAESRRRAQQAADQAIAAVRTLGAAGEPLAALAGCLLDRRQ